MKTLWNFICFISALLSDKGNELWSDQDLKHEAEECSSSLLNKMLQNQRESARQELRRRGHKIDFGQWPYTKNH